MKVNQKTGVYNAVVSFCHDNGIDFEDGMHFEPSKEQRHEIVTMVATAMEAGEIELSEEAAAKYDEFSKLKSYCNGLVSNWLRKDKRLNGNTTYQIKNPGSRAGSGDKIIKELRKLKKTFINDAEKAQLVQDQIDERLATIQASKVKSEAIDFSVLDPELLEELDISNS